MKNSIITLAAFLIGIASTYAQTSTGIIKGKVFDKETGAPLPGAAVFVEIGGEKFGTATDSLGNYTISALNSGTYNVQVSFMTKQNQMVSGVEVTPNKMTFIDDLALADESEGLPAFVLKEFKEKLIDIDNPTAIVKKAAFIKNNPARRNIGNLVVQFDSGIQASEDGQQLYFRGSRSDAIGYYIDGVKTGMALNGIPSQSIGSVTVYTGGVPAKYGDVTGGVIIVETKSYLELYNEWEGQQALKEELERETM
jgi:hypothetical protein